MGSILSNLKTSNQSRPSHQPSIITRRNKLLVFIHEQTEAVKARLNGHHFTVKRRKTVRNPETGLSVEVFQERPVKECWWTGNDGLFHLELRYGWKPLEIAKGKSVIEVGEMNNLVPILEQLKLAVESGEFDQQLNAIADRYSKQLVRKK